MENINFLIDVLRRQIMVDVEQYERMLEVEHTIHANELDEMMKKHFVELIKLSKTNVQTIQQEELVEIPQVENKNILKLLTRKLLNKELKL